MLRNFRKTIGETLEFFAKKIKGPESNTQEKTSQLYTAESHPELIANVQKSLEDFRLKSILEQVQNLEKAVYHLCSKQQKMIEGHKDIGEALTNIGTNIELIYYEFNPKVPENLETTSGSEWILNGEKKSSTPSN